MSSLPSRPLLIPCAGAILGALLTVTTGTLSAQTSTTSAAPGAASAIASSAASGAATSMPRFAPGELQRRLQRVAQRIDRARQDGHIPGVALGIVVDDQPVLLSGYGLADVESQRPVAADTLFAIGSTTKAFTATLCAMLVDEGKLAWDDPIARYVPEFALHADPGKDAPFGREPVVSVRDVLSHRTGFSRNDVLWAGNAVPRETILATAAQAEPWAPYRTQFLYNNVQVMSAGVGAARIEGTDWDTLVARRLLAPLHMSSTNTSVTRCAQDPRLALGYAWQPESSTYRHLPMRNLDAIAPAGAINSNVTDMAQWVRLLLGGGSIEGHRLVSVASLEETWSPQINVGSEGSYGLCWFLSEWQGHRVVEHGGNIDGFAAEVALLPDDGVGFVLLSNVSATPLQTTSRGIVFEELLGPEPVAGATEAAPAPSAATLAEYVGEYICNSPRYRDENCRVLVRDGQLAIDVPRQPVYTLRPPNAQGRWVFEATNSIEISFQRNAAGAVAGLTMYQGGLALEMPKVGVELVPDEPLEPLARLLGEYDSDGQRLTVMIHNQRLALDVAGQMIYELKPADGAGRRAFRALAGYSAEFVEQDGAVVAVVSHQPNGDFRFARKAPPADAGDGAAAGALPDLAAVMALRGSNADAAAWEALGDWQMSGRLRFANAGLTGKLTSSYRASERFREDTDLSPYGFARHASDGTHAWTESIFAPWRELEGSELRQSRQSPVSVMGDWRTRFSDIRVTRRDVVEGRDALVVQLRDGDLPPVTVFVAADNGDLLRVDSTEFTAGETSVPQSMVFGDWRDVAPVGGGRSVRVPFHSVTRSEEIGRLEVQYEQATTGLTLPDATFVLAAPASAAPTPSAAPKR